MKLLCSTSKGIVLVEGKTITPVYPSADKKTYGISWNKDNVFICRQNPSCSVLVVMDKKFNVIKEINMPDISDAHQIYWDTNWLYIANTRFNRIHIWHSKNGFKDFAWNRCGRDRNHINSIWKNDTGDWYFVEHNRHVEPIRRSRIKIFDSNFNYKADYQVGRGAHNIYRKNADLFICSSNDFSFIKYDVNKKEVCGELSFMDAGIMSTEFWLSRGMAYNGSLFYIGLSRFCPQSERINSTNGAIAIVDNNMRLIDHIPLPDMGQVYEVRLMDTLDLAHNRIPF